MKRYKKNFAVFGLAVCIAMAMVTPAFAAPAADGAGAQNPQGDDTLEGVSTGNATITSEDGTNFATENDDDNKAKADDLGGADINVWAKVIDSSTKIYKVDIGWGAMKFEFTSGAGIWDTTTHTYGGGTGNAAWKAEYLDGTNNKVKVTNHSNNAVDASFLYEMGQQAFNTANTSDDAVVGNFFADNTKAQAGGLVLTGTHTGGSLATVVPDTLTGAKVSLPTADAYNPGADPGNLVAGNNVAAGERTENVFFAFSGTPDGGRADPLQTFKKVGVITVQVAPNNEPTLNQPAVV